MKICHVITRLILGGAQENTLLTVRGLHRDSDFEVDLVTGPALGPEGDLVGQARNFGLEPVIIDSLRRAIDPVRDTQAFMELRRFFRENDYDLIHTHSSKAGILGRWAAREAGIPWIFHTIHGLPFHQYQARAEFELYRQLERATATITHEIQTVCDRMAEKASDAGVQPIGRFRTVYSGMELQSFLDVPPPSSREVAALREKWDIRQDDFVFGKIARLFHLKGHRYCLDAFARIADRYDSVKLVLVGDGILREKLEGLCQELGIRERVIFAGLVAYHRIPEMLTMMDTLVHTSLREGLARVIPQAQAAGRPVISYDIDGAPEAIEHERTGLLVPPKKIKPLVNAMERMITEEDLREAISKDARSWVTPRFRWKHMADRVKDSYRALP